MASRQTCSHRETYLSVRQKRGNCKWRHPFTFVMYSTYIFFGFPYSCMAKTISVEIENVGTLQIPETAEPVTEVLRFARATVKEGFDDFKDYTRLHRLYMYFCERMQCLQDLPNQQLSIEGTRPQLLIEPWDEPAEILEQYMWNHLQRRGRTSRMEVSVITTLLEQICALTVCLQPIAHFPWMSNDRIDDTNYVTAGYSPLQYSKQHYKEFAIYFYNFGNYRNEMFKVKKWMKKLSTYGIDVFFFTDDFNFNISLPNFQVIYMNASDARNGIPGPRVSSKKLKFCGHKALSKYRYWIHTNTEDRKLAKLDRWLANGLTLMVKMHPNHRLFISKHMDRSNVQEEVSFLKQQENSHLQPQAALDMLERNLKLQYKTFNKANLMDTGIWVLDTFYPHFVSLWAKIYDTLIGRGLWRDQILYPSVMGRVSNVICLLDRRNHIFNGTTCDESHSINKGELRQEKKSIMHKLFGKKKYYGDIGSPKYKKQYPRDSEEDSRCIELAVRRVESKRSLNIIRASLEVARVSTLTEFDFVETNVAEGDRALAVVFYLACSGHLANRKVHLFDSWNEISTPMSDVDAGFQKGTLQAPYEIFSQNVKKWGRYYEQFKMEFFFTWKEVMSHLSIHKGLLHNTIPDVLSDRRVAVLYCGENTNRKSIDCMDLVSKSLQDGSWVFHDSYYTSRGSYLATHDWIRKESSFKHGPINLVSKSHPWYFFAEDSAVYTPPQANFRQVEPGLCHNDFTAAGFWKLKLNYKHPIVIQNYERYLNQIDMEIRNVVLNARPAGTCALLFFGLVKRFDIVLPSVKKYLLSVNPTCDVYAHTYNIPDTTNPRNYEHNEKIHPNDIFKLTANAVMDSDSSFHSVHDVTYYRRLFPPKSDGWYYPHSMDNMVKQWHSIERVWGLMQSAEDIHRVQYKRVGFFRLDTLFTNSINLNDGDAVVPNFGMTPMNDRLFYGIRKHAEVWATGRFRGVVSHVQQPKHLHSERFMHWLLRDVKPTPKSICVQRVRANGRVQKDDCKW